MKLYRDEGMVLRSIRLGETDRIVTIFTKGRGRVRAVAKGVRKSSSKFGGRLEPLSHVAVQLYEGRDLDTVTQVESIEANRHIREDLDLLTRAATMLETVDRLTLEREPNEPLAVMLFNAVSTLSRTKSPLVVPAFLLKVLALEGMSPHVHTCVSCDSEGPLVGFQFESGGLVCGNDRGGAVPVHQPTVRVLQLMLGGQLAAVLGEGADQQTLNELDTVSTRALETHLERRLRSAHHSW